MKSTPASFRAWIHHAVGSSKCARPARAWALSPETPSDPPSPGTTAAATSSPRSGCGNPMGNHLGDIGIAEEAVLHVGTGDVFAIPDNHVLRPVEHVPVKPVE
ncbi:MAG: hypothetical protein KY393_07165 [Actinobacteria bacterium]|nr:hypothetical protein [Actinomycetota bacterium]